MPSVVPPCQLLKSVDTGEVKFGVGKCDRYANATGSGFAITLLGKGCRVEVFVS